MVSMLDRESPWFEPWGWNVFYLFFCAIVCILIDFIRTLWQNMVMENIYKRTKTTVSFINYHFVFCSRYRRKIFDIPGLEARFKELTAAECKKHDIDILAMECHHDYVHMLVSAYPQLSIPEIMKYIRKATSRKLREEFKQIEKMPYIWTLSYFVSTAENVSDKMIRRYVEEQKRIQ